MEKKEGIMRFTWSREKGIRNNQGLSPLVIRRKRRGRHRGRRNNGDAINSDNKAHNHVLEVGLDEENLLVQGIDEMITEDDGM
jgi:hypothetical protein